MDSVDLMLVGCGMMGRRHLRSYAELEQAMPGSLRLQAVCDPRLEAAEEAAEEAEQILGYRPRAFATGLAAVDSGLPIAAADVVTDNKSHPDTVIPLLEAGVHVQLEKPLAVTIEAGRAIVDAAARTGRILTVGENNRRDPVNRLLAAVVAGGLIGDPYFVSQAYSSPGRSVVGTPWRHAWEQGGLALDVGVHLAYLLEYVLGPIDSVSAVDRRVRDKRRFSAPDGTVSDVPVECDDLYAAQVTFASGVVGTWSMNFAAVPGPQSWRRLVEGTTGAVESPNDRSGRPLTVFAGDRTVSGEDVLELLPQFELPEAEAKLFGPRGVTYEQPGTLTDRKLLAAETADFLHAIRTGSQPEVTAEGALRSIAVALSLLESSAAAAPVQVQDVLEGRVRSFQDSYAPQSDLDTVSLS